MADFIIGGSNHLYYYAQLSVGIGLNLVPLIFLRNFWKYLDELKPIQSVDNLDL